MTAAAVPSELVHVAVVIGGREVRLLLASRDLEVVKSLLARYVGESAGDQLSDQDATAVRRSLERGDWKAAIDRYFSSVGRRWDQEFLVIREVPLEPESSRWERDRLQARE